MEAKKQARQAQKEAYKLAKEQEKAQKLREKEMEREMRMLERQREREAKKQQKGLKKKKPKYNYDLDTPVETQIVRVKRITAEGKNVVKGTPGGDYLLDQDNNDVYCANTYNVVGKWSQMEGKIVFKR